MVCLCKVFDLVKHSQKAVWKMFKQVKVEFVLCRFVKNFIFKKSETINQDGKISWFA